MLAIFLFFIVLVLFVPNWWVNYVMNKHHKTINGLPGTGGELAEVLIKRFNLNVSVETTKLGSHYDPSTKTVRLSPEYYHGKSLTSVAIAAHEVGHAVQDFRGEEALKLRQRLVLISNGLQKLGSVIMFISPVAMAVTHSPALSLFIALIGILSLGSSVLVHLMSLPVEFDASFNKALALLEEGKYVTQYDLIPIKQVLLAASLTYVSAALASLLNVMRWIQILRR